MVYMDLSHPSHFDVEGVWWNGIQVWAVALDTEAGWADCYVVELADGTLVPAGPNRQGEMKSPDGDKWNAVTHRFYGRVTLEKP